MKNKILRLSVCIFFFAALNIFSDGFIVIPEQNVSLTQNPFPLEVKYHTVNVEINDRTATTYIEQEFYNSSYETLEGMYIFPIPEGAVINEFSMFINGVETYAELLDATEARNIYEEIVATMRDPALLEYNGRNIFKVRIFPIEPYSTKRVKISYNEILEKDMNTIEYIYPLNTEKFSSSLLDNVSVNVNINSSTSIKNIYCTSHQVDIVRNGNRVLASYEDVNVKPDTDFKLYFTQDNSDFGVSVLTHKLINEDGFFFLDINPGIDEVTISEKDITFVLDSSGSMIGQKLEQAKDALKFCLYNLNEGDRFEIIRFSTEAESLFNSLMPANQQNINTASNFIENFRAIGGTNIEEALELSLNSHENNDRPHMVIFITDGKPTIGETNEDILISNIESYNIGNMRVFTFGIGQEINTHLLDRITNITKAYRTYIQPDEDLEVKISQFYSKVQSPVLTNINITIDGNIQLLNTYPDLDDLPDLFYGSSLTILGKYRNNSGNNRVEIIIEGKINNESKRYTYDIAFPDESKDNETISELWAARRVGHLLDLIRLYGESRELIDEVVYLARNYGIVTPYTSYLIIEDEQRRVVMDELDDRDQTLGNMQNRSPEFVERGRTEYENFFLDSGEESVQLSIESQELNTAQFKAQINQGEDRLAVIDNEGIMININEEIQNVQGRAFYNSGIFWNDSQLQSQSFSNTVRIQFASKEYFELIESDPESAEMLALGRNVRFVMNNQVYEIYE